LAEKSIGEDFLREYCGEGGRLEGLPDVVDDKNLCSRQPDSSDSLSPLVFVLALNEFRRCCTKCRYQKDIS
jgi:hypothetical protein